MGQAEQLLYAAESIRNLYGIYAENEGFQMSAKAFCDSLKEAEDRSKIAQYELLKWPKIAHRSPTIVKMGPRWLKKVPRWPKRNPRRSHEDLKWFHDRQR